MVSHLQSTGWSYYKSTLWSSNKVQVGNFTKYVVGHIELVILYCLVSNINPFQLFPHVQMNSYGSMYSRTPLNLF